MYIIFDGQEYREGEELAFLHKWNNCFDRSFLGLDYSETEWVCGAPPYVGRGSTPFLAICDAVKVKNKVCKWWGAKCLAEICFENKSHKGESQ